MKLATVMILLLPLTSIAQTFDANGNIVDSGQVKEPPNPALYEQQKRSMAVMNSLTSQTPEYWDGSAVAAESMRGREAAQRQAARRVTYQTPAPPAAATTPARVEPVPVSRSAPPRSRPHETFHANGPFLNGSNGTTLFCHGGFCH